jgi:hypothetical protein
MRKRACPRKPSPTPSTESLRAMVRDAEQEDIALSFPFGKVRWPEKIVPGPSPFTESNLTLTLIDSGSEGNSFRASSSKLRFKYFTAKRLRCP